MLLILVLFSLDLFSYKQVPKTPVNKVLIVASD